MLRTYFFAEREVEHALLQVDDAYRNRAVAPKLILQSFAAYDTLGIERVLVHASLQSGRWYWAGKVGYAFMDDRDRRHVERWAAYVLGALDVVLDIEDLETPQQWALLGTALDRPPRASFARLAGVVRTRDVPMALLDPTGTGVVGCQSATNVKTEQGHIALKAHLQSIAVANGLSFWRPVPLGKLIMLSGPDWWGVFDLTDGATRNLYADRAQRSIEEAQKRLDASHIA